jgi:hypothetical protein
MTMPKKEVLHLRVAPCVEVARCGARGVKFVMTLRPGDCEGCRAARDKTAQAARSQFGIFQRAKARERRENIRSKDGEVT